MKLTVDIQNASEQAEVPGDEDIQRWIETALHEHCEEAEVSVRLVDEAEMTALNETYRQRQGPTNVLSFPSNLPEDVPHAHLGDIVVCAPVVNREALEQGKTGQSHWVHMFIHGSLHLLGYDHVRDKEAQVMESIETAIMNSLGLPCPYDPEPEAAAAGSAE